MISISAEKIAALALKFLWFVSCVIYLQPFCNNTKKMETKENYKHDSRYSNVEKNIVKEAEKMAREFKITFKETFGVEPLVVYTFEDNYVPRITIQQLEALISECLEKNYRSEKFEGGIKNRKRERILVLYRQLFLKIAQQIGYTTTLAASVIGYTHCSAVYARRKIEDFLRMKDDLVMTHYKIILDAYEKRYGDAGVFPKDRRFKLNPESVLPSLLDEREHLHKDDKHSSGDKESDSGSVG